MRIRSLALFTLLAGGFFYLLWAGGCSEDNPTVKTDQIAPLVSIENPVAVGVYGATIEDSTTVVVRATDNGGIDHIELWCAFHQDTTARQLAPVVPPREGDQYAFHWTTEAIPNGWSGSLYAVAVDQAGNRAASEKVRILIINKSQVGPPTADFVITPGEGDVTTSFSFDPSVTGDPLSEPVDILVRWDFNGDGVWDVDTTNGSNAAQIVTHTFAVPDTYNVTLEAFNRYYSVKNNAPGRKMRRLTVRPANGNPRPPAGQVLVRIEADTYPIGALPCPSGSGCQQGDADEIVPDTLRVRISNAYFIDRNEVTNFLYKGFLNAAMESSAIVFDDATGEVRSSDGNRLLLVLDPSVTRLKYQVIDSTFWVDAVYESHPVTGVTWYGATAYAAFYGLRLPTEAEWEIAARGRLYTTSFFYPWTPPAVIDGSYANFRSSGDPFEQEGTAMSTTPVGSYNGMPMQGFPTIPAQSPMGTFDQAGNVAEWVSDRYGATTYQDLYNDYRRFGLPPIDPQGPDVGTERVLRGGSFMHWPWELRVTNRQEATPLEKAPWIGFRTAYTVF